ncbi:hypothetical protein PR048_006312 [Dryococelus australis]|uniref:Uncharacterized protein n=1 Tax=Dryococelus australis TaxID=614101 RepID=A0ABQ9IAP4_9NEOP|nr:hypothetical protein PR048_006312 [Dryococelus australis]
MEASGTRSRKLRHWVSGAGGRARSFFVPGYARLRLEGGGISNDNKTTMAVATGSPAGGGTAAYSAISSRTRQRYGVTSQRYVGTPFRQSTPANRQQIGNLSQRKVANYISLICSACRFFGLKYCWERPSKASSRPLSSASLIFSLPSGTGPTITQFDDLTFRRKPLHPLKKKKYLDSRRVESESRATYETTLCRRFVHMLQSSTTHTFQPGAKGREKKKKNPTSAFQHTRPFAFKAVVDLEKTFIPFFPHLPYVLYLSAARGLFNSNLFSREVDSGGGGGGGDVCPGFVDPRDHWPGLDYMLRPPRVVGYGPSEKGRRLVKLVRPGYKLRRSAYRRARGSPPRRLDRKTHIPPARTKDCIAWVPGGGGGRGVTPNLPMLRNHAGAARRRRGNVLLTYSRGRRTASAAAQVLELQQPVSKATTIDCTGTTRNLHWEHAVQGHHQAHSLRSCAMTRVCARAGTGAYEAGKLRGGARSKLVAGGVGGALFRCGRRVVGWGPRMWQEPLRMPAGDFRAHRRRRSGGGRLPHSAGTHHRRQPLHTGYEETDSLLGEKYELIPWQQIGVTGHRNAGTPFANQRLLTYLPTSSSINRETLTARDSQSDTKARAQCLVRSFRKKGIVSIRDVNKTYNSFFTGATVAERLDRSPLTMADRVQSPAVSLRIFVSGNRAGRCRWSAGFLGDLPFPPPLHSGDAPYSPHFNIGFQDLAVKSRPNLYTNPRLPTNNATERKTMTELHTDILPYLRLIDLELNTGAQLHKGLWGLVCCRKNPQNFRVSVHDVLRKQPDT